MDIGELEGFHQTKSLVDRSTDWQIIYGDLSQDSLRINDKETSQGDSILLPVYTVCLTDGRVLVSQHRDGQFPDSSLFSGGVDPGQVAEVRIRGAGNELTPDSRKVLGSIRECDDLSWTYECEVQWVEEKDHVFALIVIQGNLLELTSDNCGTLEDWGWFPDLRAVT